MDVVRSIETGVEATGRVVRAANPAELGGQSPCEEWDARGVLNHLVGGMTLFATAARGESAPEGAAEGDLLGDDPVSAYERAGSALVEALRAPGVLDGTFALPGIGEVPGGIAANIAFMEVCIHGWDLARATGQAIELDDETGEQLDGIVRQLVSPQFRQAGAFGEEQPAPDGASPVDKAAAFTGRKS